MKSLPFLVYLIFTLLSVCDGFSQRSISISRYSDKRFQSFRRSTLTVVDEHIDVDEKYCQLQYIMRSPDILLVDNFLSKEECESIMRRAVETGLR